MTTGAPYRRRRRTPIVTVVSVLAVGAVVTWSVVLVGAAGPGGPQACPAPPAGDLPGTSLEAGALDDVAPAPPATIPVRVLNAGGQRGQANLVAAQLADLGFGEAEPPRNDPFFPDGDMDCFGQLRFGPAGEGAASTLSLVLPCVELIRDDRPDPSVDVSVGTGFGDANPSRPVRDVLETLGAPSPAGGEDSADPPTTPDPAALSEAREAASC